MSPNGKKQGNVVSTSPIFQAQIYTRLTRSKTILLPSQRRQSTYWTDALKDFPHLRSNELLCNVLRGPEEGGIDCPSAAVERRQRELLETAVKPEVHHATCNEITPHAQLQAGEGEGKNDTQKTHPQAYKN